MAFLYLVNERNLSSDWPLYHLSNYLLLLLSNGNITSLLQPENFPSYSPNKQRAHSTLHTSVHITSPYTTPSFLISALPNPAHYSRPVAACKSLLRPLDVRGNPWFCEHCPGTLRGTGNNLGPVTKKPCLFSLGRRNYLLLVTTEILSQPKGQNPGSPEQVTMIIQTATLSWHFWSTAFISEIHFWIHGWIKNCTDQRNLTLSLFHDKGIKWIHHYHHPHHHHRHYCISLPLKELQTV